MRSTGWSWYKKSVFPDPFQKELRLVLLMANNRYKQYASAAILLCLGLGLVAGGMRQAGSLLGLLPSCSKGSETAEALHHCGQDLPPPGHGRGIHPDRDRLLVRRGLPRPQDGQRGNLRHARRQRGPQDTALQHQSQGDQPGQRQADRRAHQRPGAVHPGPDHRPHIHRGQAHRHGGTGHGPGQDRGVESGEGLQQGRFGGQVLHPRQEPSPRKKTARKAANALQARGYRGTRLQRALVGGRTIWRVQAGAFTSLSGAGKAEKQLEKTYPGSFILAD